MPGIYAMLLIFNFTQFNFSKTENNQEEHIYYYSTLKFVETPLSPIEGSVALSKSEAMQRNHYRFIYNPQHQLQSVAFYNGDTPREPNHTRNHFMLAHRMDFHYTASTESVLFYDTNQKATTALGKCSSMWFELDALGRRSAMYFLDKAGHKITNSWGIYRYTWSYQDDGAVIEDRFGEDGNRVRLRPSFDFHRLRLRFDHLGHIALMQNIDQQGNLVENTSGAAQDRIFTNAQGHLLEWNVLDKNGELEKGNSPDVAKGIQTINAYGYEVALENQDEASQAIFNHYSICKSKTTYDPFGNLSERWFYDKEGNPTVHQSARYHHLKITWDKTGNRRIGLNYFAVNGQPTIHQTRGFHSVAYAYDEQDRMTKMSYHAPDGQLVNRKDNGRAYAIISYAKETGTRTIRYFNKEGVLIND
ncbi:MAG: hypothetical protein AAF242_15630 [Bacteroidota bacterium]